MRLVHTDLLFGGDERDLDLNRVAGIRPQGSSAAVVLSTDMWHGNHIDVLHLPVNASDAARQVNDRIRNEPAVLADVFAGLADSD
eukprot:163087-Amphidinium_carterae.1